MRIRIKPLLLLLILLIGGGALFASRVPVAAAQSAPLSVSITPPLFHLTIGPGDTWSSSIKVVNPNTRPVTYYAQAEDFKAQGETGTPSFIPLSSEASTSARDTYSLASWIDLTGGPVTVPAGGSGDVPFTIHVPKNAEPGGHYAAVLIGTQPSMATSSGTEVKIASYVSSLFFVNIKGDVVEQGRIIEFSTAQGLYQSPKADFTLRFENMGNTHVQPQGDITIYNMWGKERGMVPINQNAGGFGDVLPGSIRRFQFSWSSDNPFDIGRYRAVVTLAYGQESRHNVSATTYFWVIPVIPVMGILASLVALIWLITWLIRRYIRRALSLERERLGLDEEQAEPEAPPAVGYSVGVLMEPIREGVVDLRNLAGGQPARPQDTRIGETSSRERLSAGAFLRKYRLFVLFVIALGALGFIAFHYLDGALTHKGHFKITDVKIGVETASSTPGAGVSAK